MAKQTKTWKLGENAKGGVITVEITGKAIAVIGKEWDFSKGSNRGSDQSGAKEFTRETIDVGAGAYAKLYDCLADLTTHYYAEEIIKWIGTKIPLNKGLMSW